MGRKHETYVSGHSELNAYEPTILHYHLIINHRLNYFKIIILKVNKLIIHDNCDLMIINFFTLSVNNLSSFRNLLVLLCIRFSQQRTI